MSDPVTNPKTSPPTETLPQRLREVIKVDELLICGHRDKLVREHLQEALDAMLDAKGISSVVRSGMSTASSAWTHAPSMTKGNTPLWCPFFGAVSGRGEGVRGSDGGDNFAALNFAADTLLIARA